MKYVRPYRLVILIVLPVVVLVLIRAWAPGSFKPDAARQAEASLTGANLLDQHQVAALGSKPLIVKLVIRRCSQANRFSGYISCKGRPSS